MSIELRFTSDDWCELANAVASKASQVKNGIYSWDEEEEGLDPKEWAAQMDRIYEQLADALNAKQVVF